MQLLQGGVNSIRLCSSMKLKCASRLFITSLYECEGGCEFVGREGLPHTHPKYTSGFYEARELANITPTLFHLLCSFFLLSPLLLLGKRSSLSLNLLLLILQVNQLRLMAPTSNLTSDWLVLENLAPGDAVSAEIARPLGISSAGNVWSLYYDRYGAPSDTLVTVTRFDLACCSV